MQTTDTPDLIHDRNARGATRLGWLDSRHTFSFGSFLDPARMGFRSLRVINDDTVAPGSGFGAHSHRDMEILTLVLDGALEHKDSLGNGSTIAPGDAQIMSAGTGVTHSEFNASTSNPVHFLQIWIIPERPALSPRYEQRSFERVAMRDTWLEIAAREPARHGVRIMQDVSLLMCALSADSHIEYAVARSRFAFAHVARGTLDLNGTELREGDGAQLSAQKELRFTTEIGAEILLFDLA